MNHMAEIKNRYNEELKDIDSVKAMKEVGMLTDELLLTGNKEKFIEGLKEVENNHFSSKNLKELEKREEKRKENREVQPARVEEKNSRINEDKQLSKLNTLIHEAINSNRNNRKGNTQVRNHGKLNQHPQEKGRD